MADNRSDYQAWVWQVASAAAKQAQRYYLRDIWTRIYLYHKRGSVMAAADKPDGYDLTTAEYIPRDLDMSQLTAWTHERLMRARCLPVEK